MKQTKMKMMELLVNSAIPESRLEAALQVLQDEEQKPKSEGFLSVKDTMAFLGGISRPHLWKMRREMGLPSHMVGGRVVFSRKELSDWVMKNSKA